MTRKEAERLVDSMLQYNDAGMLNEFGAAYAEIISSLCQEPNQPEGQPVEYDLTIRVDVTRDPIDNLVAHREKYFVGFIKSITGHWHKVEEREILKYEVIQAMRKKEKEAKEADRQKRVEECITDMLNWKTRDGSTEGAREIANRYIP